MEKKLIIISMLDKGETGKSLARFYNVGKTTITDINPSRAHFPTRNIAGMLGAFWPQAKKTSRKERIHYFE